MKYRWFFVSILLVGNIFAWANIYWQSPGDLKVYFLDVGQGDAIFIKSPTGRTMLIDGGPGKNILARVASVMPFGASSIDLLMESHPDTDHVGGLPDVASHFTVRGVIKPCIDSDNSYDQALHKIAQEKHETEMCAEPGETIDLGGEAKMEILYAGAGEYADTNGASIVTRLVYGQTAFLFTGDATVKEEKYLEYTSSDKLRADVYKVSHHGSRESNDFDFIKTIGPKISVISVGASNRYGHPHQEVLDLLAKNKSVILRTDQLGTIEIDSDGETIKLVK